jgi:anti-sigma B factor antagonist
VGVTDAASDPPGLRLTVTRETPRTRVAVTGELDLASAEQFVAGLRRELAERPVLLDLGGLSFLDSSGLRAIDTVLRDVDREGWSFGVCAGLADPVRQVLEMTGMLGLLPIVGTEAPVATDR